MSNTQKPQGAKQELAVIYDIDGEQIKLGGGPEPLILQITVAILTCGDCRLEHLAHPALKIKHVGETLSPSVGSDCRF